MMASVVRTCALFQAAAGLIAPTNKAWRAKCDASGVVSYHDFGLRVAVVEPPTHALHEPPAALETVVEDHNSAMAGSATLAAGAVAGAAKPVPKEDVPAVADGAVVTLPAGRAAARAQRDARAAAEAAEAPTLAPVVAEAPTAAPAVAEAPTLAPIVAEAPTHAPVVAEAPTPALAAAKPVPKEDAPAVAEAPTLAPVVAEAPAASPREDGPDAEPWEKGFRERRAAVYEAKTAPAKRAAVLASKKAKEEEAALIAAVAAKPVKTREIIAARGEGFSTTFGRLTGRWLWRRDAKKEAMKRPSYVTAKRRQGLR